MLYKIASHINHVNLYKTAFYIIVEIEQFVKCDGGFINARLDIK